MSKELFENLRETEIIAQISEEIFHQIPSELRQSMKLKSIDEPNWKEIYKKDKEWKQLNAIFVEALKARKYREDEIRANY